MAGRLYNQMNQQPQQNNGPAGFFQALNDLKSKGGDPNQMIQQLLSSGKVTQAQVNAAAQKAQQLQRLLGGQ